MCVAVPGSARFLLLFRFTCAKVANLASLLMPYDAL